MLEAARIDGATEVQVFFRVVMPTIKGSIITVSTTIAILTLKIYDIVRAMTNGNFGTNVIATQQYDQLFTARDSGRAAALAIILLLAVMPVVLYNLRQFRNREGFR
jgi:alpha-glucoside transport system permease protein